MGVSACLADCSQHQVTGDRVQQGPIPDDLFLSASLCFLKFPECPQVGSPAEEQGFKTQDDKGQVRA